MEPRRPIRVTGRYKAWSPIMGIEPYRAPVPYNGYRALVPFNEYRALVPYNGYRAL